MTSEPAPSAEPVPPSSQWGSRLFLAGSATLAVFELYYFFAADTQNGVHLAGGLLALFLAALPGLLWARRRINSLPVFETLLLTGANTYALPLLNGHSALAGYPPETITRAIFGVVLFQIVAIAVFTSTPVRPGTSRFWREEVITRDIGRWMLAGVAINTAYLCINAFTTLIPETLGSVFRAVFFGIGIISSFIASRRLGSGQLSRTETAFFIANLAIQVVAMLTSLYLVSAMSLLLLTLIGYISASGRIPVITTLACLAVLAVLHNGKSPMRNKYWHEDDRTVPTVAELPSFFSEWFTNGLTYREDSEQGKMTGKLVERSSLIQMLCLVVNFSPACQPFLYGETYADIPAQFVPRLVWPDKPLGHVSNSRLSVYYGLQSEEETAKTTIGFGMLSEAYANFGYYGLAGLGLVVGFLLKKIQGLAEGCPLFSYGGLFLIILLAWSFQVEFTVSIWLASLYQAAIAVLGIPFVLRQFFGR